MLRHDHVADIITTVSQWHGIVVEPHKYGGREFKWGKLEIGHIHRDGMLDIPYTKALREYLVSNEYTNEHHLLPETGWSTYYVQSSDDVNQALWLLKLSYLQKKVTRNRHNHSTLADLREKAIQFDCNDILQDLIFP